jgi:hypothetical protein
MYPQSARERAKAGIHIKKYNQMLLCEFQSEWIRKRKRTTLFILRVARGNILTQEQAIIPHSGARKRQQEDIVNSDRN